MIFIIWMLAAILIYILLRLSFFLENYQWTRRDRLFAIAASIITPVGLILLIYFIIDTCGPHIIKKVNLDKEVKW